MDSFYWLITPEVFPGRPGLIRLGNSCFGVLLFDSGSVILTQASRDPFRVVPEDNTCGCGQVLCRHPALMMEALLALDQENRDDWDDNIFYGAVHEEDEVILPLERSEIDPDDPFPAA